MKFKWIWLLPLVGLLLIPPLSQADVRDDAGMFGKQAVDDANTAMATMKQKHNKEFVVETFTGVPDDQKSAYDSATDKPKFFRDWMASRAKALKVNGVYVLICKTPPHIEGGVGKNTREHGDFTQTDLDNLVTQMRESLHDKEYDKALSDAVDSVDRAYGANINEPNGKSTYTPRESEYTPGQYHGTNSSRSQTPASPLGAFGTLICLGIGVVLIVSLIRAVMRGGGGGFSGGNYGGGYGNYGPGYGGGGGGGFGRGLLGGLLGGAVGSWAENRWENRGQNSGGGNQQNTGGFFGGGNSGGGGGVDSGPSDAGQGFGDTSSGGDFGGGGGGGGGGDSGSGSSGGDF